MTTAGRWGRGLAGQALVFLAFFVAAVAMLVSAITSLYVLSQELPYFVAAGYALSIGMASGVVVLLLSQHQLGWAMVKPFLKQLATTPPLLATLAGIGWALAGWTVPPSVDKALTALGEMALPLGLLGVGGSLVTVRLGEQWRHPLVSALVKTALSPLLGWAVGRALGLGPVELKVLLIMMACPTAIVSYTMVLELKGDEALAAGAISLSVLTSLVSLALIVGLV